MLMIGPPGLKDTPGRSNPADATDEVTAMLPVMDAGTEVEVGNGAGKSVIEVAGADFEVVLVSPGSLSPSRSATRTMYGRSSE